MKLAGDGNIYHNDFPGDTANSTAPAPVFGGFGAIKPLVSSSNSDSAASSIPGKFFTEFFFRMFPKVKIYNGEKLDKLENTFSASSPFSGFGLPASASKASDPSTTAASAVSSIPPFTGFGASFGKTPGIASTVSASASAPALFGFGGNGANNKPGKVLFIHTIFSQTTIFVPSLFFKIIIGLKMTKI